MTILVSFFWKITPIFDDNSKNKNRKNNFNHVFVRFRTLRTICNHFLMGSFLRGRGGVCMSFFVTQPIILLFYSAHCAFFIEIWQILRGVCISFPGQSHIQSCTYHPPSLSPSYVTLDSINMRMDPFHHRVNCTGPELIRCVAQTWTSSIYTTWAPLAIGVGVRDYSI